MIPSVFVKKKFCLKFGGLDKIKQPGSDYILWMMLNKKYRLNVLAKKLTFSKITNKTITGNFNMKKYIFISKKKLKTVKMA